MDDRERKRWVKESLGLDREDVRERGAQGGAQTREPYYPVRRTGRPALGNRGQKREAAARGTEGQSGLHDRVQ